MKKVGRSGAKSAPLKAVFQIPAVQALLLQIISFFIVLLIARGIGAIFGWGMNILIVALLQGAIAAGLAWWRGLASWWLAIQFLFPLVLVLALSWQLPPSLFLAAFLFFLCLYWTTFRTQVPFYPSRLSTWEAVTKLLPPNKELRFIDVGSGLGGLVLDLAKRRPESRFIGTEIAPLPWLVSVVRARLSGSSARFERGDYGRLNFADYDVVFAYLSPVAMPALWTKAKSEMRPGAMLLSYEFLIPNVTPDVIVSPEVNGPELYVWHI
ncbi:MAG: class I SAM-dependent methyltransferase [Pseudomonadota bacterium]